MPGTPGTSPTSAVTVTQPLAVEMDVAEANVAEANAGREMFEKSEEPLVFTRLLCVLLLVEEVVNI